MLIYDSRIIRAKKISGFTLLEILMVMVIIALLAAITGPTIGSGIKSMTFKTSLNHLMAAMRYCRSRAISSKLTYHVTFSFEENGYQVDSKDPKFKDTRIEKDFTYFPEEMTLHEILEEGEAYNQGQYQVSFFPKGNSTGEQILLKNYQDRLFAIQVDQVTGRVFLVTED